MAAVLVLHYRLRISESSHLTTTSKCCSSCCPLHRYGKTRRVARSHVPLTLDFLYKHLYVPTYELVRTYVLPHRRTDVLTVVVATLLGYLGVGGG